MPPSHRPCPSQLTWTAGGRRTGPGQCQLTRDRYQRSFGRGAKRPRGRPGGIPDL